MRLYKSCVVSTADRRDKMGFKSRLQDIDKFRPMDLSEDSVHTLFNRCRATEQTSDTCLVHVPSMGLSVDDVTMMRFDQKKLDLNKSNIEYLYGQLLEKHINGCEINLSEVGVKYDNSIWTKDNGIILQFLHLGRATVSILPFNPHSKSTRTSPFVKPTLSPKDPDFPEWWEIYRDEWEHPIEFKERMAKARELACEGNDARKRGDFKRALELYEKAAEEGDAGAQYLYAWMCFEGEGTEQDKKKALYWFEKAAARGYVDAQFNCGVMYYKGEGTEQDKKKALYWYEKAAGRGIIQAQINCGKMYLNGEGTEQDKKKALFWFEKAAARGNVDAQTKIGLMYLLGDEIEQDMEKASFWLEKARENGDENAKFGV